MRWTLAALSTLAADEYSRTRQLGALKRAHDLLLGCARDLTLPADRMSGLILSTDAEEALHAAARDQVLLEAARLLANLSQSQPCRQLLESLSPLGGEKLPLAVQSILRSSGLTMEGLSLRMTGTTRHMGMDGMGAAVLPPIGAPPADSVAAAAPSEPRQRPRRHACASDGVDTPSTARPEAGARVAAGAEPKGALRAAGMGAVLQVRIDVTPALGATDADGGSVINFGIDVGSPMLPTGGEGNGGAGGAGPEEDVAATRVQATVRGRQARRDRGAA